ncbi:MAG: hypothetical protein ABIU97_00290 [Dehalococcoidia bacterium]
MTILVIRGGVLQAAYDVAPPNRNFNPDEIWLVDWDNISSGDVAVRFELNASGDLPSEVAAQIPRWTTG